MLLLFLEIRPSYRKSQSFIVVSRWSGFHVQRNSSSTEAHWIFCNKSFLFVNNGTRPKVICKRCFYLQNRPGLHVVNWLLRFCQNWRILSSSLVMMVSGDERLNTCCSVSKDISKAPMICHNVCLHKDQKDRTPCTASSKVSLDRCWCICIRMWPYVVMNELNHYKSSSCCPAHLHILDTPRTYQRPSLCAHGVQREFPKL